MWLVATVLAACAISAATPRVPIWIPLTVPALVATAGAALTVASILAGEPFFPTGGMDDWDAGSWGLPLIVGGLATALLLSAVLVGYLIRVARD